ncbi:MAG TPA: hypothetical protein VE152_03270, partial [Acidimicrobiales bacterium]|nr:hypothetical protein [Acidimicrobiales bacterium]
TQAAQACLAVAAPRQVGGHTVLVVVVSLGQPNGLAGAGAADKALLDAATPLLRPVPVLAPNQTVGHVVLSGGHRQVPVVGPPTPTVMTGWPGITIDTSLMPQLSRPPLPAQAQVGTLTLRTATGVQARVPVHLGAPLPPP